MECYTWGDAFLYIVCTVFASFWFLSPFGVLLVCVRVVPFIFFQLPIYLISEFKIINMERRTAGRPYSSIFEFSAMAALRWVLATFQASVVRSVFLSEFHARALYFFRRVKYGTENVGDFVYTPVNSSQMEGFYAVKSDKQEDDALYDYADAIAAADEEDADAYADEQRSKMEPRGYWVKSRSRESLKHDLVMYFVPGNVLGIASSYFYLEFLSMLLVQLQVQGFRNPAVFCLDTSLVEDENSFASYILTVSQGWAYVQKRYPKAKTVILGSGIGGTAVLSMLLHFARDFVVVDHLPKTGTPKTSSRGDDSLIGGDEDDDDGEDVLNRPPSIINETAAETDLLGSRILEALDKPKSGIPACRSPDAMLLISPMTRVSLKRKDTAPDVMSRPSLAQFTRRILSADEEHQMWTMPGCIRDAEWWKEALPTRGTCILYGGLEALSSEIHGFTRFLSTITGVNVVDDCTSEEFHSWPIVRSFVARNSTDQQEGIVNISDHIANMLVMDCLQCNIKL